MIDPVFTEPSSRTRGKKRTPIDLAVTEFLLALGDDSLLANKGISVVEAYGLHNGVCGALFQATSVDNDVLEFVRTRMLCLRRRFVRYYRPGQVGAGRIREALLAE